MNYYYTKTNEINALYNYANLNSQSRCPINILQLKPILPREGLHDCTTNLVSNKTTRLHPCLDCSFAVALLSFWQV